MFLKQYCNEIVAPVLLSRCRPRSDHTMPWRRQFFAQNTRKLYLKLMSQQISRYASRLCRLQSRLQGGWLGCELRHPMASMHHKLAIRVVPPRPPQELNRHRRKNKSGSAKLDKAGVHTACPHVSV
uniref:Uncharacterized protein n=1 Tax=Ixodes ricinus TaxID=34613 RepID=A0A6B0UQX5_IXORI